MPKISAGLIMFRRRNNNIEVLLVHPGGPLWTNKDIAGWSIPKGLIDNGEAPLEAAQREFEEETGITASGEFLPLKSVTYPGGKVVQAWLFEGDCDPSVIKSNDFSMEWPPGSGHFHDYPEVDRAAWFGIEEAKLKIHKGQAPLLNEVEQIVSGN